MSLVTETSHDCCIKLELVRMTVEHQRVEGSEIKQLELHRGTNERKKTLYKLYLYYPTNRHGAFGNVTTCDGLGIVRSCNEQQKK